MLVGQLPDLRETQSGKDLIAIGVLKGIEKGKRQALIQVLESRFGQLDAQWLEKVEAIEGSESIEKVFRRALTMESIDGVFNEE